MNEKVRTNTELLEEISFLSQRIKLLEQSESELMRRNEVIQAHQRLHEFSPNHNMEELLRKTLDEIEVLTDSQIGFFHFLSADERTIYLQTWSTNTLKKMCNTEGAQKHYSVDQAGVWADCIHQRQAVIHNDYAGLPNRKGMPQGHALVIRELVVPVIQYGRIVAILGVGNKPNDYSKEDVHIVSTLALLAWNIVERERGIANLTNESSMREALLDNIPNCIALILKKDTKEIVASNKYARCIGAVPGQKCFKTCAMRDDNCPFCLAPKLWETGQLQQLEVNYLGKWYKGIWAPLSEDLYVHYILDITESKRAEYELIESEKHYRTLFDSIDEGFCIIEVIFDENENPIDYRFLEINPSFERQTGLIDVKGKRMRELAPKHEEHWFEIYGKIAVTGEPARFVNRAEQLQRWYDVYAFRFGQPENRQVAILFKDMTERKQSEEALHKSEASLREAQRLSNIGSWDLDLQKNRLFWSDESYRIFEIKPSEFGISYEAFLTTIHPDDREMVNTAYTESVKNRKPYAIDHRLLMKDGRIKYV